MIWIAPCISQVNSTLRHLLVLCFHQSCFVASPTSFFFSLLPPTQSQTSFPPSNNQQPPPSKWPTPNYRQQETGGGGDPLSSHFNLTLGCVSFPSQLSTDSGACPADCSAGAEYITREAEKQWSPPTSIFGDRKVIVVIARGNFHTFPKRRRHRWPPLW